MLVQLTEKQKAKIMAGKESKVQLINHVLREHSQPYSEKYFHLPDFVIYILECF